MQKVQAYNIPNVKDIEYNNPDPAKVLPSIATDFPMLKSLDDQAIVTDVHALQSIMDRIKELYINRIWFSFNLVSLVSQSLNLKQTFLVTLYTV